MRLHMKHIVLIAIVMVGATPAFADVSDPKWGWGTVDDSLKCGRELTDGSKERVRGDWVGFKGKTVVTPQNATAECTAEIEKRAMACTTDPTMERFLKDNDKNGTKQRRILKLAGADGPRWVCADQAWERLQMQFQSVPAEKRAAAQAKAAEEERRALAE